MPQYVFKCELGHYRTMYMTFRQFEATGRQLTCLAVVGSGNRECESIALPVIHAVQFTVKPGWWDDEADRKQVKKMLS
ncbi:hypothetical protein LCGC14_1403760 [marine sediment metagenome]|uniref:Uncharacterized protein n=1 Tax=marine sediment metagenome TaxID=412755 RepID=A0A0F9MBS0_9ZZZZ